MHLQQNLVPYHYYQANPRYNFLNKFSLLLFSRPFMSNSLQPHGLWHAKPPYPSSSLGVFPSLCPLHWVMPFSHLIL